ncbi:MAG: NUDIX domain-containing protein [Anaerolineae bacterium]|nr:NUDIX domain-containing protein [Thermoflexales bacterium]MDW8396085.1 NUDIX domain-containing protein [Anaerolineae bacterium]
MAQPEPWIDWTGQPVLEPLRTIRPGASAVVFDGEGRLLLHQRADNQHWALPGGGMDPGETIAQTCLREVREETGLEVAIVRLIGIYSDPAQYAIARYPTGELHQILNVCFECRVIGGSLRLSAESIQVGFFDPSALPQPLLLPHRVRIQDALRREAAPVVR